MAGLQCCVMHKQDTTGLLLPEQLKANETSKANELRCLVEIIEH